MSYDDLTTYVDEAGVERWADGTKVSKGNAFCNPVSGESWTRELELNSAGSRRTSARITKATEAGENPGRMYGVSRKANERMTQFALQRKAQEGAKDASQPSSP